MLVLSAIIAVLVSLLMPALGSMRERGRRVTCVSNLRQLSVTTIGYAGENKGAFPPYFYQTQSVGGGQYTVTIKPNWSLDDVGFGAHLGILTCPSDTVPKKIQTTNPAGQPITVATSYAYNFTLFSQGITLSQVMNPTTTMLFCDGWPGAATNASWWGGTADCSAGPGGIVTICHKPGSGAEQTKQIPPSALGGHLGHGDYCGPCGGVLGLNKQQFNLAGNLIVDRRHTKKMNVVFLDGHVEWLLDLATGNIGP
jgi:prepilin-type processing-associated H-X9-DG protein